MIPGKPFDPATETSRRPTPEKLAHLREWATPIKRDIRITNITEMTNINQQLEQNAELYVSNIINRVIAQLIGKYGDGFVTLEATADGELKVKLTAADIASLIAIELTAGTNLIGKVQIAGTSLTVLKAVINVATATDHTIATPASGKKIQLRSYALTVGGDVGLTWLSEATAISGIMAFGGTDEPRGIAHNFGDYPLETVVDEVLALRVSAAEEVDGYITYTEE